MYAQKCAKSKMCSKIIYKHIERIHKYTPFKLHAQKACKKCKKYEMYAQINSLMNNKSVVSEIKM